jgi:hypothetical protein
LIIGNDDLPKLRAALMKAPRLRALLKRLVA